MPSFAHASTKCSLVKSMAFGLTCAQDHFCEVVGKLLNLFEPLFSHCALGLVIVPYKVVVKTNIIYMECLAQCLVHSKCSINDE